MESDGERHHDGELEVDDDEYDSYWADWDIDCHGNYYTENCFRREHPNGYRWSCCGALGSADGCKKVSGEGIDELYATSPELELDEEDRHHPGELEVDYDGWPDHDTGLYGRVVGPRERLPRDVLLQKMTATMTTTRATKEMMMMMMMMIENNNNNNNTLRQRQTELNDTVILII